MILVADRLHPNSSPPPRIRTTDPPDPLPTQWARAIANDIAAQLRRGWRASTAKRAITSRGAPITGRDYHSPGGIPGPTPTTELVSREVYAAGLVDPIPALGVPWLAWHLTQLDLAQALNHRGLMQHATTVDAWLKHKPKRAPRPASVYLLKPNRHGKLMLRRNSDYAPLEVVDAFLAAVDAATITVPDPLDLADALAEWERISLEEVLTAAS